MSERRCEHCGGTGKTGPVHINRGDAPHEWRESMPCSYCVDGVVSDDLYEAQQLGKKLRESRIARQETIYEQARRLGISSAALSALQRGQGGMVAWHHPFATAAWLEATKSSASSPVPNDAAGERAPGSTSSPQESGATISNPLQRLTAPADRTTAAPGNPGPLPENRRPGTFSGGEG